MLINELQKLGLNDKESKIYLCLLELGGGNIGQIAKKSGIKRTTVYDVIASLAEKGLVSSAKKNKRPVYFAEDPKKLEQGLEEKKEVLARIMPEILSVANFLSKKPRIRFFEGPSAIKEVYRDTLNYPDQEIDAWFTDAFFGYDDKFINDYYIPKRLEKKIWVRAVVPGTKMMKDFVALDRQQLRKTKIVPAEKAIFKVEIVLYGENKIGIMSFSEQIALIIESKNIFETLKGIFELNWESPLAKETPKIAENDVK